MEKEHKLILTNEELAALKDLISPLNRYEMMGILSRSIDDNGKVEEGCGHIVKVFCKLSRL